MFPLRSILEFNKNWCQVLTYPTNYQNIWRLQKLGKEVKSWADRVHIIPPFFFLSLLRGYVGSLESTTTPTLILVAFQSETSLSVAR